MKVLVLTQFSEIGGASRINALQLIPYLKKYNIMCDALHFYTDGFYGVQMGTVSSRKLRKSIEFFLAHILVIAKEIYCIAIAPAYDVIYIQREVFPRTLYWLLRRANPRIVYEIEDTIYEINPHLRRGYLHDKALRYQADLCLNMMKCAMWVVAENSYLYVEAKKHNDNVSVMTCPINTIRVAPGHQTIGGVITLGWIGSPSTTRLLDKLRPTFRALGAKYGGRIQLVTVGASPGFHVDGISHNSKQWALDTEVGDLRSFHIGLMPLDDDPFNRGRLGGKMIQYMSVGIPIVADNIGLNRSVVKQGVNGYLVNDDQDWVERISYLVDHEEERRRMGHEGRRLAEKEYSISKQSMLLADIFKKIAGA